jgi:hypothetical protein
MLEIKMLYFSPWLIASQAGVFIDLGFPPKPFQATPDWWEQVPPLQNILEYIS